MSDVTSDPVALSRAIEREARTVLARGDLGDRLAGEIKAACRQLDADRANGEALDASIRGLQDLLARYHASPRRGRARQLM
jgi:hypothetical protein